MKKLIALALCGATLSACASPNYTMTPVAGAGTSITYQQGTATAAQDGKNVAVKVTPMGITQGGFVKFAVAVINKGPTPADLSIDNLVVSDNTGTSLHVYSTDELTKIAKQRAMRAQVAVAILSGVAAGLDSANSYSYSSGYVGSTPVYMRTYDPVAANIAIDRDSANAAQASANINQALNNVIGSLHDSALQMTTVNPGMAYGGLVWTAEPKNLYEAKSPMTITVAVNYGGEQHVFNFQLAKQ